MKDEQRQFLSLLTRPPVRLTAEQTAWVLNCQPHDIPILVAARLIRPLGNPPANGIKYFATAEILELAEERNWLARMTNALHEHWQVRNAARNHPAGRRNGTAILPNPPGLPNQRT
ncbi:MAG: hypothetical protein AB7J34_25055 [Limisphaerales bacterium]